MSGHIYHITTRTAWSFGKAAGMYRAESLEQDGFIHCSKASQILRVANKYYHGQTDMVILRIDPSQLRAEVRWEQGSDKPEELFPHIYGPIDRNAVVDIFDFSPGPDGSYSLPAGIK